MKKITATAYHRNGVAGAGFHLAIFRDDDGSEKLAVYFPDHEDGLVSERPSMRCAILDLGILATDTGGDRIAFGRNSWRGDRYADFINRAIVAAERADIAKYDTPTP